MTPNVQLKKRKFLVPAAMTVGALSSVIRRYIDVGDYSMMSFHLFAQGRNLPTFQNMGEIYRNYQQPDGFLHVGFRMESTFG
jgi:hypothetical protein